MWRGLSLGTRSSSGVKAGCWACVVPAVRCDIKACEDREPLGLVWEDAAWRELGGQGGLHLQKAACGVGYLACQEVTLPA